MTTVRIASVGVAHPRERLCQRDVPALMGLRGLAAIRARAVVRGSRIAERRIVLPPDEIRELGAIEARNTTYQQHAPELACAAVARALGAQPASSLGALITTSCTGYSVPSLGVEVSTRLGLSPEAVRLPVTEAGCAGGVLGLARAADYVAARPRARAGVAAVELCSLSFHRSEDEGVLTSNLIFGDGAGAAVVESGPGPGLEVAGSSSFLVPDTRELLGFTLKDEGFLPVLSRRLVGVLPPAAVAAAGGLLARHGLRSEDVGAWLVHPGGSRILSGIEKELGIDPHSMRWSWASLREFGNTSSAAIFDVLRRYLCEPGPEEWGMVVGFGPGVSIELVLVRRRC